MFCPECGEKNKKGVKFCESCGAALVEEEAPKSDSKESNVKSAVAKPKKEFTKKQKITYSIIAAVVVCLIGLYMVGKNATDPKTIAKKFFLAQVNADVDAYYDCLDINQSEFTTKEVFTKIMDVSEEDKVEIVNYTIGEVTISENGLTASVPITYVEKDDNDTDVMTVNLVKTTNKRYFIFDEWKINVGSKTTVSGSELSVLKGSTVTIEGIAVDKKYLVESDSENFDVYKLPSVFTLTQEVKATLPNGYEITEDVYFSEDENEITLDDLELSDEEEIQMENTIKEELKYIYQNALEQKSFDEIKSRYEKNGVDLEDLEKQYNNIVYYISRLSFTLSSIDFESVSLEDIDLDSDGNFSVSFEANGMYEGSYQSGDEIRSVSKTYYDDARFTFGYDNGFHLIETSGLNTYFSRY